MQIKSTMKDHLTPNSLMKKMINKICYWQIWREKQKIQQKKLNISIFHLQSWVEHQFNIESSKDHSGIVKPLGEICWKIKDMVSKKLPIYYLLIKKEKLYLLQWRNLEDTTSTTGHNNTNNQINNMCLLMGWSKRYIISPM